MRLSKRSTPSELAVIAWIFIVLLAGCGIVAISYSFRAAPDQARIAQQLRFYGVIFLLLAGIVLGVQWKLRKWLS